MKTMKQVAAMLLALCMLVGMPMAVGAADDTPLTITSVTPNAWGDGENNKIKFTFSEEVDATTANLNTVYAAVGIYKGTGEGQYRYKWDSTNNTCTQISGSDFDGQTGTTQWTLSNFGRRSQANNRLMGNLPTGWTLPMIIEIYQMIKAEYPQARLVAKLSQRSGAKDGFVDGICALNDSSKKLTVSNVSAGLDWAETNVLQEITGAELVDGALMMHFANPVNRQMNANYMLGLYDADGVLNAEAGSWTVSADALRYYGEDQKTLATNFDKYDEVMVALAAKPDHELRLTVVSKIAGNDLRVSDETDMAGRQLLANTTVDGVDAAYVAVSTANETLRLEDVKFYGENQALLTFNKPISQTANHWPGFTLYSGGSTVRIRETESGYELATGVTVGTDGWQLAQWKCATTFEPLVEGGTQYLTTLPSGLTVDDMIEMTTNDAGYVLRFRIQENANQGANNGVVDTIWAATDTNDRLMANVYDANQDMVRVDVSGRIQGEASVGSTGYETLDAALVAAKASETVSLMKNVESDLVMVPAGVTLDLSGKNLTTNVLVAFGAVIDSTDGNGKLVMSNDGSKSILHLQANNPYMPMYDTDGYRFFVYRLTEAGTKDPVNNPESVAEDTVKFGIKLAFDNVKAYELLAADTEQATSLHLKLTVAEQEFYLVFKPSTMQKLYESVIVETESNLTPWASRDKKAITLTVSGLGILESGDVLTAVPTLYGAGGVVNACDVMTYTYTPVVEG